MPDLTSITTALAGLKHAGDLINMIRTSEKNLEQAELKVKLADAAIAVSEARTQVAETQTIILERNETIRELQEQLKLKGKLTFIRPYYILQEDDAQDGPFCQKCYDSENKLIRLQTISAGAWDCKVCNKVYCDSNYKPSQPQAARRAKGWATNW